MTRLIVNTEKLAAKWRDLMEKCEDGLYRAPDCSENDIRTLEEVSSIIRLQNDSMMQMAKELSDMTTMLLETNKKIRSLERKLKGEMRVQFIDDDFDPDKRIIVNR